MESTAEPNLIKQTLEGDHRAFRTLVEMHHMNVFNLVIRIVQQRELAEEIAQDVFLKAFRSLRKFKGTSKFSTWLYRIAYNEAVTNTRKKRFQFEELEETHASVEDGAFLFGGDVDIEEEQMQLLETAVKGLKTEAQLLLGMYYQQDLSVKEISEITGESESNVKVRLFRTRKQIQESVGAFTQQP
ncbi:MAG: RNA polymerase sigma factor [Flavobacteriales bacterium]|nr:RNA polymerase sigma factor [Flavobacteriales bacterium]